MKTAKDILIERARELCPEANVRIDNGSVESLIFHCFFFSNRMEATMQAELLELGYEKAGVFYHMSYMDYSGQSVPCIMVQFIIG